MAQSAQFMRRLRKKYGLGEFRKGSKAKRKTALRKKARRVIGCKPRKPRKPGTGKPRGCAFGQFSFSS